MNKRIKKKRKPYYGYTRIQYKREYIKTLRYALHRINLGCGDRFLKYMQNAIDGRYTMENDIELHHAKNIITISNAVKVPVEYVVSPGLVFSTILTARRLYKRELMEVGCCEDSI